MAIVNGKATGTFHQHGHGVGFVQEAQFAVLGLFVGRVQKDAAVNESSMHVGHHGSHITSRIARGAIFHFLNIALHAAVPVAPVSLVDGVDGPFRRNLHARMREHKLARARIERKPVDVKALHGEHQLRGAAVHGVPRAHKLGSRLQHVLQRGRPLLRHMVDGENGADANVNVNVAGAVERVHGHHIVAPAVLHHNGLCEKRMRRERKRSKKKPPATRRRGGGRRTHPRFPRTR